MIEFSYDELWLILRGLEYVKELGPKDNPEVLDKLAKRILEEKKRRFANDIR